MGLVLSLSRIRERRNWLLYRDGGHRQGSEENIWPVALGEQSDNQAARESSVSAITASSNRSCVPVFEKMLCKWRFTVFSLMPSSCPMSLFLSPRATSAAI